MQAIVSRLCISSSLHLGLLIFVIMPLLVKSQQVDTTKSGIVAIGHYILYRNHDTSYIKNYSQKISVKLVSMNKYNYFRIHDGINNTSVRYNPVRDVSLGLGVAYKWFSLDVTIALGLRNRSEFENTRSFDIQAGMFSSKQYASLTIQYYQAYEISGFSGIDVSLPDAINRREDARTINLGLKYMFATNYTRFSIKAPFVQNEGQRKSAGSPIIGAGLNVFVLDADSSIVPDEVADYFVPNAHLVDLNLISASVSMGYMYSFVYKKRFFLTLGLIPGLNIYAGDYHASAREYLSPRIHLKINTMNAIGYNSMRFFTGFQFLGDTYFSRLDKKLTAEIGHGKFSFFIGYRFGENKK